MVKTVRALRINDSGKPLGMVTLTQINEPGSPFFMLYDCEEKNGEKFMTHYRFRNQEDIVHGA